MPGGGECIIVHQARVCHWAVRFVKGLATELVAVSKIGRRFLREDLKTLSKECTEPLRRSFVLLRSPDGQYIHDAMVTTCVSSRRAPTAPVSKQHRVLFPSKFGILVVLSPGGGGGVTTTRCVILGFGVVVQVYGTALCSGTSCVSGDSMVLHRPTSAMAAHTSPLTRRYLVSMT